MLLWLLALAATINALAYTASAANPILVSDNWFFLRHVVMPYAHGLMEPADLLLKRGALDHSQPLQRLLLIANYEWFDLDMRVEAVFAVLMGALGLLLLAWLARAELRRGGLLAGAAFATMAAVYFSLSATVVFTWSLVTLGFLTNLALFLWLAVVWRGLANPRPVVLGYVFAATLLLGLVADDTGLIAAIAASTACLLYGARERRWRWAAGVVAAIFLGYFAYSMLYRAVAPTGPGLGGPGLAFDLASSLESLENSIGDAWLWAAVPLTESVVHRAALAAWFGDAAQAFVAGIAAVFAVAHCWFWAKAFRGTANRPAFIAVAIMLIFYGLVAGTVIARVSTFGPDYLWQPRYASMFRLHLVALLLMLVAQAPALDARGHEARATNLPARATVAIAATLLSMALLAQVPFAMAAWRQKASVDRWNGHIARQLQDLATDPSNPHPACAPQLKLCQAPAAERSRIVGFLSNQHLSVFSPDVRRRNDLPDGD